LLALTERNYFIQNKLILVMMTAVFPIFLGRRHGFGLHVQTAVFTFA